jgi:hypothetical protein
MILCIIDLVVLFVNTVIQSPYIQGLRLGQDIKSRVVTLVTSSIVVG